MNKAKNIHCAFCSVVFFIVLICLVVNYYLLTNVRIFLRVPNIFLFFSVYFFICNDSKQFFYSLIYMHPKNCILLTIAKNPFISANLLSGMSLNKGKKAQKNTLLNSQRGIELTGGY